MQFKLIIRIFWLLRYCRVVTANDFFTCARNVTTSKAIFWQPSVPQPGTFFKRERGRGSGSWPIWEELTRKSCLTSLDERYPVVEWSPGGLHGVLLPCYTPDSHIIFLSNNQSNILHHARLKTTILRGIQEALFIAKIPTLVLGTRHFR